MLRFRAAAEPKPKEQLDSGIVCPVTQGDLFTSPIVLNAVLAMPEVGDLPWIAGHKDPKSAAEWLARKIEVRKSKGAEDSEQRLLIAMKGDDPRQLAILVDAEHKALMKEVAV